MDSELHKHLSKKDLEALLSISHRTLSIDNHDSLKNCFLELQKLIPFENAVSAQGDINDFVFRTSHKVPKIELLNISYPECYLDFYFENQLYNKDATFCEFLTKLSPVHWLSLKKKYGFDYPASVSSLDLNMKDGWTYGTINPKLMTFFVFFFCGPYTESNVRAQQIIKCIIPYFSEAYSRVLELKKAHAGLTKREIEVLHWVKEGKSSWEISMILKCSARNIDFHISNVKNKLNAMTRAQAVAIALHRKIIEF